MIVALTALFVAAPTTGSVLIRAVDARTQTPVAGRPVQILSGPALEPLYQGTTGKDGTVRFTLPAGPYAALPISPDDYLDGVPAGSIPALTFAVAAGREVPVTMHIGRGATLVVRTVQGGNPVPRDARSQLECERGGPLLTESSVRRGRPDPHGVLVEHRGVRPGQKCTITVWTGGLERVLGPFDVRGGTAVLDLITPEGPRG